MAGKNKWRSLFTLLKLAELGAFNRTAKFSTEYLAKKLGISQQTASRYLIELEKAGWIRRTVTPEGCLVRISNLGTKKIRELHSFLRLLVEGEYPPSITLEGTVFTGLGEGAYYLSEEKYRRQFIEKLGFDPYPGTLNLKLTSEYAIKAHSELDIYPAIEIEGFRSNNRTFGMVRSLPAIIENKTKGAVVSTLRSHYDASVLEIIAPVYLRKHLNLNDGYKVKVEILISP